MRWLQLFPVNVLLADKLRTIGRRFGDTFTVEIPAGSGKEYTLVEAPDLIDGWLTACARPGAELELGTAGMITG